MLVFRRREGESFRIGDDIEVRVLRVGRGSVKAGVIAPRDVGVLRTEIAQWNREAVLRDWAAPQVARNLRDLVARLRGKTEKP